MLSSDILEALQTDVGWDCRAFSPELILCGGIVLLLLLRMFSRLKSLHLGWVALVVTGVAFAVSFFQWARLLRNLTEQFYENVGRSEIFSGMLVYDYFTVFLRLFLLSFTFLVIWLSLTTGIPDKEDSADFYTLLLGATVGMMVMAETNHLLMMFIGIEMASLPSYALAGYLKGRRDSSEAALKYVVYGGGAAAGVMLYGISLLAGKFGTGHLPQLATGYIAAINGGGFDPILVLGTLFIVIGIAFKLAAVPFHFWCPDVFEGASAEVAGFLSVASKGAALALLARVALNLFGVIPVVDAGGPSMKVANVLVPTLAVLGILTATFGNLAAFRQTNLKRLLAYSTIAHAGYMIMGLAAFARRLPGPENTYQYEFVGAKAVLVYLVAYLFMNLGAFAVIAFLRNQTGSEELSDYRGLVRRSPWMTITLCIFLLSLLGIPPLIGFVAKIEIFMALWQSAESFSALATEGQLSPTVGISLYTAFLFLGLNSVLSAVYYVKVMKTMIIEEKAEDVEGQEPKPLPEPIAARAYALIVSLVVLVGIFTWAPMTDAGKKGTPPPIKVSAARST